jgi:hypothetical protein
VLYILYCTLPYSQCYNNSALQTLLHSTVLIPKRLQCFTDSTALYHTHSATTTVLYRLYFTLPYSCPNDNNTLHILLHSTVLTALQHLCFKDSTALYCTIYCSKSATITVLYILYCTLPYSQRYNICALKTLLHSTALSTVVKALQQHCFTYSTALYRTHSATTTVLYRLYCTLPYSQCCNNSALHTLLHSTVLTALQHQCFTDSTSLYRTHSATTTVLYILYCTLPYSQRYYNSALQTLLHSTVLTVLQQQCFTDSTALYRTHSATTTVLYILYCTLSSVLIPKRLRYSQRYNNSALQTLLHSTVLTVLYRLYGTLQYS